MESLSAVYPQRNIQIVEIGPTSPKINRARAREIVRCLIWTLILLSLAIGVCSVMAWYIFHPRVPVIQINSLSVSNLTVRAEAEMGFTVINENSKMDLWFSKFDVFLLYKNREILTSHFESFSLQKRNQTSKNVEFAANMSIIEEEVNFSVTMEGCVSITYGNWYSKNKSMKISCKDLKVDFSADGKGKLKSTDQKHDCSVHFV